MVEEPNVDQLRQCDADRIAKLLHLILDICWGDHRVDKVIRAHELTLIQYPEVTLIQYPDQRQAYKIGEES